MSLPPGKEPALRILARPTDTNAAGDIFGGWLMSWTDIAGSIVAFRRARGRIVTVAVKDFDFIQPVYVDDLVSFYAEITKVGHTSLTVEVMVYAERKRGKETCERVASARLVYVALGKDRRPRPVPADDNFKNGYGNSSP
ncbi:Thioesterase superfamily [Nitrosococcus oceani ATCC 19707]|uniref:Thioesterase superfamily n=2 Tax=Nitrosococcus oceani TaxID=1229 RepID=Q3JCV9_NITOC|nr:acyl-CoA thioesterase [Nitrosococcus oceani]ABA57337.1 Thioesterase superfamily [Nitrosococcus oceani ATCC 19707]EDZ68042.1 thioesterase family protein [Nitrosococcus oceani AFC27]KFI20313.1 thioesterase [Nitrosococcus oceani C-27]GEM20211.1 acyl-CoA thioesterase [Nitrosococcus oceani]